MSILTILKNAFASLLGLWKDLPPELKSAIVSAIAKGFDSLLRKFYQAHHAQNEADTKSNNQDNQSKQDA